MRGRTVSAYIGNDNKPYRSNTAGTVLAKEGMWTIFHLTLGLTVCDAIIISDEILHTYIYSENIVH